jgi:Flp pilus assembly protein TadB
MTILIISVLAALTVILAVGAIMFKPAEKSAYARKTVQKRMTAGDAKNFAFDALIKTNMVRNSANRNPDTHELLAETGVKETVQEFYAWRFYNSFLMGGLVGVLLGMFGLVVTLFIGSPASTMIMALLAGLLVGAATGGLVFYTRGPGMLVSNKNKKSERINKNLYQLLERVASGLTDGKAPRDAFMASAPYILNPDVKEQVDLTIAELNSNVPFAEAMRNMKHRCKAYGRSLKTFPVVDSFTEAMIISEADGTNPAGDFITRASGLRKQRSLVIKQRSEKTLMTIGSIGLIGFSPLFLLAMGWGLIYGQLVEMGVL